MQFWGNVIIWFILMGLCQKQGLMDKPNDVFGIMKISVAKKFLSCLELLNTWADYIFLVVFTHEKNEGKDCNLEFSKFTLCYNV